MIEILNKIITGMFKIMLAPVSGQNPWLGLVLVSIVCALLFVVAFKFVSNQEKLSETKKRLIARILEFAVYRNDIIVNFSALGRAVAANLAYLRYVLTPVMICAIPMFFILVQVETWFARRPLRVNETALIEVNTSNDVMNVPVDIKPADSIQISNQVRIPALNQIAWRLQILDGKPATITIEAKEKSSRIKIITGQGLKPVPHAYYPKRDLWARVLNPAAGALRDRTTSSVTIDYPDRKFQLGSLEVNWLLAFIVIILVFGYAFQKLLRITI